MSLYENIHKKRKRIKDGSGETMRKKGAKALQLTRLLNKRLKLLRKSQLNVKLKRHNHE